MKHLEAVEEGTERAHDRMNAAVGYMMDPYLAQENEDCENEGVADQPAFLCRSSRGDCRSSRGDCSSRDTSS